MANYANSRIYTGHVKPILLDMNFVVDSTNGNGLGIRSLKGPYVQNVFMHTSATPAAGNSNPATPGIVVLNPNPASGTIVIQLQEKFNRIYVGTNSIVSPIGSPSTSVVAGVASIVITLGTATAAQWIAAGVPSGVVLAGPNGLPAVGTPFIAAASALIGGGATAAPTAAAGSGVATIETVGDTNQALAPNSPANGGLPQGFGAQIILQCRDYAGALVAPVDGSVIALSMLLSQSSILIAGE